MTIQASLRFWLEIAASAASGAAAALTIVWPQWIEMTFGADPDGGGGQTEWLLAAALCVFTLALSVAAGREWRRSIAAKSLG